VSSKSRRSGRVSAALAMLSFAVAFQLVVSASSHAATPASFTASADAYVTQKFPKKNFGGASTLRVEDSPLTRSYVRFNVSGLSGSVTRATLRLYATGSSSSGFEVRSVPSSWDEYSITWPNAPTPGTLVRSSGAVSQGWVSLDVTQLVTGNGTVGVALAAPAGSLYMASRETGQNAPQLVVETATTPDTTPPAAPSGLTGRPGSASASLDWGDNAETDLAGYRVYGRNADGTWPSTPKASTPASAFNDTGLTNGTSYAYRVTAYDKSGNESAPSGAVTVTPVASSSTTPCGKGSSYTDLVLGTAGLASFWRLGESSGTSACDAKSSDTGTYKTGVSLGQPGAIAGDTDTAAGFNGSAGYVNVPSAGGLNPVATISLEAWVNPTSATTSQTVLRKDGQYMVRITGGGVFVRLWWSNGSYTEMTTPAVLSAGVYQHLVVTYDGLAMRVYRNGGLVASQTATGSLAATTNPLWLGSSDGYDYLGGKLDEVAVYGAALSSSQVTSHYTTGAGSSNPAPTAPSGLRATAENASVTLDWQPSTDTDLAGYRVYRRAADGTWPTTPIGSTSATTRSYRDTGLTNGTAYTYRVTAYDAAGQQSPASGEATATPTATPPPSADPVLLAAGDIADCDEPGDEATAALLDNQPGTVAPLGDNVYEDGSASQYANCYDPTWGRQKARTKPAIGGHEYRTPGATGYFGYFGAAAGDPSKGYYSYDLGAWHVVVLNSVCDYVPGGCDEYSPQRQWLDADLSAHPTACTLAYWHHPRFSSGFHGNYPETYWLWETLYQHGAELVLSGEDHDYERFAPQNSDGTADAAKGLRQFVVGTGGRFHYTFPAGGLQPNSEVRNDDTYGVLKLTLHSGSYDWKFLPEAGHTFGDSGTTACHA
jgi:concanavalin A-like lectin/glucanase superfamily protein/fibronectin type III domain protein